MTKCFQTTVKHDTTLPYDYTFVIFFFVYLFMAQSDVYQKLIASIVLIHQATCNMYINA